MAPGDTQDPSVEEDYMRMVRKYLSTANPPERIDRFAFYERASHAFAIVVKGELRKYGNLLLKKGVTPAS